MSSHKTILTVCCFAYVANFSYLSADEPKPPSPRRIPVWASQVAKKPVTFEFKEVALSTAIDELKNQIGANILLDANGLEMVDVTYETKVTCDALNLPVAHALVRLLTPLNLTYRVMNDNGTELLLVTDMDGRPVETRVYPVTELLPGFRPDRDAKKWKVDKQYQDSPNYIYRLAEIVHKDVVAIEKAATVEAFSPNHTLVVSATRDTHGHIDRLLTTMREHRLMILEMESKKRAAD